jgi:phage baseplate assembly protein W
MPASGSPIGSTPFGTATPVAAPLPPTDGPALARYINPGSRDYALNGTNGQLASMPAIRQRMLLALFTEKGSSSALPWLGVSMPKKIGTSFERLVHSAVRLACAQLTDIEKVVRIDGIQILDEGVQGRRYILVSYTDLTTLNEADRNQSIEISLQ